jgi:hypothetical protein
VTEDLRRSTLEIIRVLSRLRDEVESSRQDAIRAAFRHGASVRAIAGASGLARDAVQRIVAADVRVDVAARAVANGHHAADPRDDGAPETASPCS